MTSKPYDFINSTYEIDEEIKFIRKIFEEAFRLFEKYNYPEDNETQMCSIHTLFPEEHHICVACNLEESNKLIINYLKTYDSFTVAEAVFPIFILLLYLMVERIEEYLNIMNLHHSIKTRYFKELSTIKKWANFVKHPKAFMFVHHPTYMFEGFLEEAEVNDLIASESYEVVIDFQFINDYYSNGEKEKNRDLSLKLKNKDSVLVILPSPIKIVKNLCEMQKYFVRLIRENEIVRETLIQNASIYYEQLDSELNSDKK